MPLNPRRVPPLLMLLTSRGMRRKRAQQKKPKPVPVKRKAPLAANTKQALERIAIENVKKVERINRALELLRASKEKFPSKILFFRRCEEITGLRANAVEQWVKREKILFGDLIKK